MGAICAAIAAAGCGGDERLVAPGSAWTPIAETLSGPLDPESTNPCNRGEARCVDLVVTEMRRRLDSLARACHHHAAFALMYLRVTQAVGHEARLRLGLAERRYLAHLDAVFAQLYFNAFDAWTSGRDESVASAWRIAFDAANDRRVTGMGDLLLGMNAHISRDLPFAVASIGPGGEEEGVRKRAYDRVNDLLGRVQTPILEEVARRFDPTITRTQLPAISVTPRDIGKVLRGWRDEAYRDGRRLLEAPTDAERAAAASAIEDKAAARGALIAAATSRVAFSDAGKARDRHCGRSGQSRRR